MGVFCCKSLDQQESVLVGSRLEGSEDGWWSSQPKASPQARGVQLGARSARLPDTLSHKGSISSRAREGERKGRQHSTMIRIEIAAERRQQLAWGVSPRVARQMFRLAAERRQQFFTPKLLSALRGFHIRLVLNLGLTPQASCYRRSAAVIPRPKNTSS